VTAQPVNVVASCTRVNVGIPLYSSRCCSYPIEEYAEHKGEAPVFPTSALSIIDVDLRASR
jgi:hypothetical protein